MSAFDDIQTEPLVLLTGCSVLFAATIQAYLSLTKAVVSQGGELTTFGHIKAFALAGFLVAAVLIAFGFGLTVVGWSVMGLVRVARRFGSRQTNEKPRS